MVCVCVGFSHRLKGQSRGVPFIVHWYQSCWKTQNWIILSKKSHSSLIRSFGSVVGLMRVSGWLSGSGIVRLSSEGVPQGRALEPVKYRGRDSNKGRLWRPLVRLRLNAPSRRPSEGLRDGPSPTTESTRLLVPPVVPQSSQLSAIWS